jgi:hypothetical protein
MYKIRLSEYSGPYATVVLRDNVVLELGEVVYLIGIAVNESDWFQGFDQVFMYRDTIVNCGGIPVSGTIQVVGPDRYLVVE